MRRLALSSSRKWIASCQQTYRSTCWWLHPISQYTKSPINKLHVISTTSAYINKNKRERNGYLFRKPWGQGVSNMWGTNKMVWDDRKHITQDSFLMAIKDLIFCVP
jgi:hypothetical protein